jgi:DNA-binding transcriptional MerR regulator
MTAETRYTVGQLAEAGGVTRRAIRFYVRKGLLPPPAGKGRGASYSPLHLHVLTQIKHLQREGLRLARIKNIISQDLGRPRDKAEKQGFARRMADLPSSGQPIHGGEVEEIKVLAERVLLEARESSGPWGTEVLTPRASRRREIHNGPDRLVPPGQIWIRQPLLPGYELTVDGSFRPLESEHLASLAGSLQNLLKISSLT